MRIFWGLFSALGLFVGLQLWFEYQIVAPRWQQQQLLRLDAELKSQLSWFAATDEKIWPLGFQQWLVWPPLKKGWLIVPEHSELSDKAKVYRLGSNNSPLAAETFKQINRWHQQQQWGFQNGSPQLWLGHFPRVDGGTNFILIELTEWPQWHRSVNWDGALWQYLPWRYRHGLLLALVLLLGVAAWCFVGLPYQRTRFQLKEFLTHRVLPSNKNRFLGRLSSEGHQQQHLLFEQCLALEQQQLSSQQQLQQLQRHVSDGLVHLNQEGGIAYINDQALNMLGFDSAKPLLDKSFFGYFAPEHTCSHNADFNWHYRHPQHGKRQFLVHIERISGADPIVWQLFIKDKSAQHQAEQQLRQQAFYDHSGIFNQAGLEQHWQTLAQVSAQAEIWIMVAIGIDRMRDLNVSFGLELVDRLTQHLAINLQKLAPRGGVCGRIARERFIIAYPLQQQKNDPSHCCPQWVRHPLLRSMPIGNKTIQFTVSCGYIRILHTQHFKAGLQRCLTALDMAQENGLSSVHHINDAEFQRYSQHSRMLQRLHNAIIKDLLQLYIHPKLRLNDQQIIGGEALVRWNDNGTWVSPAEFIPMAEKANIIHLVDKYMIGKVCQLIVQLRRLPQSLSIAVNVSAQYFQQEEFRRFIRSMAQQHQLQPEELEIEITEYSVLGNDSGIIRSIELLDQLGIALAIDDFGTGATSLQSLIDLPIQHLKIDKSFTEQLVQQGRGQPIVESIFNFAKPLGIKVTAEGIETEQQRQALTELQCQYAQGFLFYKPMSAKVFIELVSGNAEDTAPVKQVPDSAVKTDSAGAER